MASPAGDSATERSPVAARRNRKAAGALAFSQPTCSASGSLAFSRQISSQASTPARSMACGSSARTRS